MTVTRMCRLSLGLVSAALMLAPAASAERPAGARERAAINRYFASTERSLHDTLAWVHISTVGPFALAYLRGGQEAAILMRGTGTHWRSLDAVSDEGLHCGLAPPRVIADLNVEAFNDGPKPCERT